MVKTGLRKRLACALVLGIALFTNGVTAKADPSREEVYRNDELRIVVYKDGSDPNMYWYLPPLKWQEQNGRILFYKRPRPDRTEYYFYVVPYMNDELFAHIASEIPNVQRHSQLRPLILKRIGIRVPQFDVTVLGQEATDYQYINSPQMLRMSLDPTKTEDFEFFIENAPGVMTNVLFFYQAERVDRYINLELSCRDVYSAMRVGLGGKYEFIRGEIEDRIFEYLANRHLYIRSKGDIQLPDIVNRAIAECFVPVQPPRMAAMFDNLDHSSIRGVDERELREAMEQQFARFERALDQPRYNLQSDDPVPVPGTRPLPGITGPVIGIPTTPGSPTTPGIGNPGIGIPGGGVTNPIRPPGTGFPGSSPGPGPGPGPGLPGSDGLVFSIRQDAATSDRNFYFRREQVANSEELSVVPLALNLNPSAPPPNFVATPYPARELIVQHSHEQGTPLSTGVIVRPGDQYLITAVFSLYGESIYGDRTRRRYRWESAWPRADEDLFYRIGTGPWTPVNGRTLIRSDSIVQGELQFYIDRPHIWEKVPADLKDPAFFGILPGILQYRTTYPQFNVTLTGRHVTIRR